MHSAILKEIREFVPFIKDHKLKSFWMSQLNMLKDKETNIEGGYLTMQKEKKVKFNKEDTQYSSHNTCSKLEKKKSLSCSHVYNPNDVHTKYDNDTTRSITPNPQFVNYNTSFSYFPQPINYSNYMIPNHPTGYYTCNYYPVPNYQQVYNASAYPYQIQNYQKVESIGLQAQTKPSVESNSTITCSNKGNSYSSLTNLTNLTPKKGTSSKSKLLGLINKDLEIEI